MAVRPNVDIPWSIHGRIKEYAEQTDKTIEEAYIETLRNGVGELDLVSTDAALPQRGPHDFGPRLIRSQGTEARDINKSLTFHPLFRLSEDGYIITSGWQDMSLSSLVDSLAALHETTTIDDDWFTVHQLGGALIGRGAQNFATAVETANDRFRQEDIPQYKNGHFLYIASLQHEDEHLLLRGEIPTHSDGKQQIAHLEIRILTDGVPVSGNEYHRIARAFDITRLSNANSFSLSEASGTLDESIDVDVIEQITHCDAGNDETWVSGILVENPLQNNDDLYQRVAEAFDEGEIAGHSIETLRNYDTVYCDLRQRHYLSDDVEYKFKRVTAKYLEPAFKRNHPWNLSFRVNW